MKFKNNAHKNLQLDARRIIGEKTPFAVREAYRGLYTNIVYMPVQGSCKKLVFTSAYPGEGKTSVSINLAYTIATTSPKSKILLIDADMRSPRVPKLLKMDVRGKHGLSEYLAGIDEVPSFSASKFENLSILTAGAENANTPALISSGRVGDLIKYCEEIFDYIIIDTPPISVVSDAAFLTDYVDGYIVVTRADYSDINSVSDAVETLQKVDAKVLGFVLCSLDTKKLSRYGRYGKYGKYGKYGRYGRYSKYDTSKYTK